MGQCQHCARAPIAKSDPEAPPLPEACRAHRGPDPLDSSHSSSDEACGPAEGTEGARGDRQVQEGPGRGSHSSDSSSKYSRGSEASLGEDRAPMHAREDACLADMPVFEDEEDGEAEGDAAHSVQPLYGRRKVSRGSVSSERGSFSSVSSVNILKARLGRSSSLSVPVDESCSCPAPCHARASRNVSLRLPRSYGGDDDTNLPTVYVDESPRQHCRRRRSSLRRALSLLSLSTVLRSEVSTATPRDTTQRHHKPVQKILRQPRRRHNTVRGMSGLAIDEQGAGGVCPALQRAHTLYYPTAATMRHANMARRARSVAT